MKLKYEIIRSEDLRIRGKINFNEGKEKEALKYYEKYVEINNELNCITSELSLADLENEKNKQ